MPASERRKREKEARRTAILDAAEELVARDGFEATTMDAVASASEVSKGTLYLYFQNKDALCAAIATRKMDAIEVTPPRQANGLADIHARLTHHMTMFRERPQMLSFMVSWLSAGKVDDNSPSFTQYRARVGSIVAEIVQSIERGQSDGSIRADIVPLTTALHLWSSSIGVALFYSSREAMQQRIPIPVDFDALLETHITTMVRAIESGDA